MKSIYRAFVFSFVMLTALVRLSLAQPGTGLPPPNAIIKVPQQYGTIQGAINAASTGDVILVANGTYNEYNITITNKAVTIKSENGSGATIVNAGGIGRGFIISHSESVAVNLQGLTIQNALIPYYSGGGAVYVTSGKVNISNCIIQGTTGNAAYSGGPIYNVGTNPVENVVVNDCVVKNNFAANGCGISGCTVYRSLIYNNSAGNNPMALERCNSFNCTVYNNTGGYLPNPWTAGGMAGGSAVNCIFWGNSGNGGQQIDRTGTQTVTYSIIQNGWTGTGNLSSDPLFVNAGAADFHLQAGSPAIDAGDPAMLDLDGSRSDIGAFSTGNLALSMVFNKEYTFNSGGSEVFRDLVELNGSIYLAGEIYTGYGDERVTKVDTDGNVIWSVLRAASWDNDGFGAIEVNNQNELVCYGQQNNGSSYFDASWVIYDESGVEKRWGNLAYSGSNTGTDLNKLSNGNFLAVGPGINGGDFIALLDNSMTLIRLVTLPHPADWDYSRVIPDNNGNVFVFSSNSTSGNSHVYKMTEDLQTIIWTKTITGVSLRDLLLYDGSLIVSGITGTTFNYVAKMNLTDGTVVGSKTGSVSNTTTYRLISLNNHLLSFNTKLNTDGSPVETKLESNPYSKSYTSFSQSLFEGKNVAVTSYYVFGDYLYLTGHKNGWTQATVAVFSKYKINLDGNTAPTDITLSTSFVQENAIIGKVVGEFSATDSEGGTMTYSLVSGTGSTDNTSFTISAAQLNTAAAFDYETKSSYSIRVKVTDAGGLSFEKQFTVSVTDVLNESIPTNGLVAWYPFNGNANDESGNGNNGTVNGATLIVDRLGSNNGAYSFDGVNDLINCGSSSTLSLTNSKTLAFSFWIVNISNNRYYISKYENGQNSNYAIGGENGKLRVTGDGSNVYDISSMGNSAWEHFVVLYNGTNGIVECYKNGQFVGSNSLSYSTSESIVPFIIGGISGMGILTFQGNLDDIAIYNRALTAEEIQQLYTAGSSNTAPSDITLSASTVSENLPIGTTAGTFTATDVEGGTMTYLLASGTGDTDNTSFIISGDQLKTAEGFDYETKTSYSIRVKVADGGGLSFEKQFTISVTDVLNESIPTNSLVAWYPFNGNANDESGNGNNGTVYGATLFTNRFGNLNTAFSFDGNDYIDCGNSTILDLYNIPTKTISFWMKPSDLGGAIISRYSQGVSSNSAYGILSSATTFWTSGNGTNAFFINAQENYDWQHYVVEFNRSVGNVRITKNGSFLQQGNLNFNSGATTVSTLIGMVFDGYTNTNPQYFNGVIDDIAIYNRALSASEVTQLYTASKQVQTIVFNSLNPKTYGDASFALTASANSGLGVTYTSSDPNVVSVSGSTVTIKSAGTTTITASQDGNDVYGTALPVQQTLTVNKATLTATADNKSRVYGDANPTFTITYTGYKNSESSSVIDTSPAATTTATLTSNVGNYNIVPAGGTDNNYTFTYVNGTLTITKATLTATADNKSRVYGVANPAFTITYTGFKNSETSTVIDTAPTATTTAVLTSNAGDYSIVPAGGTDNNYSFSFVNGTLTINKATLTAAADNKSKTYGDTNPAFTITYTGFKNNETASVLDAAPIATTTATIASNVGAYAVVPSGGTDNNYTFSYVSGTLTIEKATITVTADNKTRNYNEENPPLTITYSGFRSNENASVLDTAPSAITSAISSSLPGTYPIVPSNGSDNNYAFTYVSGILTIEKLLQTIAFQLPEFLYPDQTPYLLTATSSSGLPVKFSVTEGNATADGSNLILTGTGLIKVKAYQEGSETVAYAENIQATTVKDSYKISGLITKPGGVKLKRGLAKLFYSEGGLAGSGEVIEGVYEITLVRPGIYFLQVVPTGDVDKEVFPTYYKAAQFHGQADMITVSGNQTITMEMLAKGNAANETDGKGVIKGKVITESGTNGRLIAGRILSGKGMPNVPVYLLEEAGTVIKKNSLTDSEGNFEMIGVVSGKYRIALDVVGVKLELSSSGFTFNDNAGMLEVTAVVNEKDKTTTVGITMNVVTGIEDKEEMLTVYPNPVKDKLVLAMSAELRQKVSSIEIYSMEGRKVVSQQVNSAQESTVMDVSELSSGMYLMQIRLQDGVLLRRFVKQ